MKTLLKGAMLASLGLAALSVQAQYSTTDLVLGFTGGTSGSDVLFDIGTPSSIGVGGTSPVDLSLTLSPSLLSGNGYSSLAGTSFGVVGFKGGTSAGIYSTVPVGNIPNTVPNKTAYNGINLNIQSTGGLIDGTGSPANSAVVATSNPNSWSANMAHAGTGTYYNDYGSPDVTLTGGTDTADLYFAQDNGSAPQLLGTLTLNDGTDQLTFTPAVVPEPTTNALLAASGLLALAFGRYFRRKVA